MIKYLCDCCNRETDVLHDFSYQMHLDPDKPIIGLTVKVHDKFYQTSGRIGCKSVCLECYNEMINSALNKFKQIKNEVELSTF